MSGKYRIGLGAFLIVLMLAFACADADAARFGGGRSFGGRPSMSQPFTRRLPPMNQQGMRQQTAPVQRGPAAAAPRPGLFGGMGGLFGGLLAGSLIGSLLFGGPSAGAGFFDLIVIAVLLYFGIRLFARRREAARAEAGRGGAGMERSALRQPTFDSAHSGGGFDWSALSTPAAGSDQAGSGDTAGNIPSGFDDREFLRGARAAYIRLNESWDKRDLRDIAQFTTPSFFEELRRQAEEDKNPGITEIMLVNAAIVEVRTEGDEEIAQVYFNVLLREDPAGNAPEEIREVWHFVRPAGGKGTWKLDGIQQVS